MKSAFNKIQLFFMISISVLVFTHTSIVHARLYVEIAGGGASGLPIGVVPFGGDASTGEELARIIRSDLKTSGLFRPLSEQETRQFPTNHFQVQTDYWKGLGVDNLVVGNIQKSGSRFSVNFELLDIIKQKDGTQRPLLTMHFDNISVNETRALAHHISDLIFEKLIGVRGIFSTRIAYISVHNTSKGTFQTIEVADYDGHNPKPLYRSQYPLLSPTWSPDGKKIAFVSFDKERQSVNVVDVNSGRVERISQYPGINSAPAWSKDGRTLALVLSKDGGPKIYTIDLASHRLTKVTDGSGADTEPVWSPDGNSIVFTSDRGGKAQVYRVTLGTGKVDRLTFKGSYNTTPSLTPDNKNLVTLHRDEDGMFSIATHNLGSGSVRVLTQASLNESPRLAPNGMMVIYSALESGRRVLGAVTLDGRLKIRLPAQEGDVKEPAWSPFSQR